MREPRRKTTRGRPRNPLPTNQILRDVCLLFEAYPMDEVSKLSGVGIDVLRRIRSGKTVKLQDVEAVVQTFGKQLEIK